jgi:hypothetical protein
VPAGESDAAFSSVHRTLGIVRRSRRTRCSRTACTSGSSDRFARCRSLAGASRCSRARLKRDFESPGRTPRLSCIAGSNPGPATTDIKDTKIHDRFDLSALQGLDMQNATRLLPRVHPRRHVRVRRQRHDAEDACAWWLENLGTLRPVGSVGLRTSRGQAPAGRGTARVRRRR